MQAIYDLRFGIYERNFFTGAPSKSRKEEIKEDRQDTCPTK
jgi:hypothetical protein